MDILLRTMLEVVTSFQTDILDAMESVAKMPFNNSDFPMLWTTITEIYSYLYPIGCTLATFCFLLGFLKKTAMFELVNWENIVKCLLRLIIAKIVLDHGLFVLEQMAGIVHGIIDAMPTHQEIVSEVGELGDPNVVDFLVDAFLRLGFIEQLFQFIMYIPYYFIMLIVKFIIYIVLWGRFLQICLYAIISPIPMATMVAEETSDIAKKFFLGYTATLLQGLMIIVILYIYVSFMSSGMTPRFGGEAAQLHVQIAVNIMLAFMLAKSGNWAKQIMGI